MNWCLICGARVVPGRRRKLREGPEGLLRCIEHLGTPTPETIDPMLLEPVEGEDYYWAERREYIIYYEATARATWTGYHDDDPTRHDLEPAAQPEIQHEEHREVVSVDRFPAIPDTNPPVEFREEEWREQVIEDLGLRPVKAKNRPRPEQRLEVFA